MWHKTFSTTYFKWELSSEPTTMAVLSIFSNENIMHLSFASPWVDPRDTPRELFLVTNKIHSKPLGIGHKIMTNSPSLGESINNYNIKFGIEMK